MNVLYMRLMPWKWEGAVLTGGTPADVRAWAKKFCDAEIENGDNSAGHAYVAYGKPWFLWVDTLTNVPALAHEAFHVTCGILEARGLKHTAESEEAYTYTMEDIVRQTLEARRREWERV